MLISQPKIKGFEELPAYTRYFFTEDFVIDAKVREKVLAKGDPKARSRRIEVTPDGTMWVTGEISGPDGSIDLWVAAFSP